MQNRIGSCVLGGYSVLFCTLSSNSSLTRAALSFVASP
jgi:hypothetical protein